MGTFGGWFGDVLAAAVGRREGEHFKRGSGHSK